MSKQCVESIYNNFRFGSHFRQSYFLVDQNFIKCVHVHGQIYRYTKSRMEFLDHTMLHQAVQLFLQVSAQRQKTLVPRFDMICLDLFPVIILHKHFLGNGVEQQQTFSIRSSTSWLSTNSTQLQSISSLVYSSCSILKTCCKSICLFIITSSFCFPRYIY